MRLLAILAILALFGCKDSRIESPRTFNQIFVSECAGFVSVKLNLPAAPPSKVRLVWNGSTRINECQNLSFGQLDRDVNEIRYSDGGFGYTAPSKVSLQVYDLGDCSTSESLLFEVVDATVSANPPTMCESFALEFTK